ncbi:hypothetical protein RB620_14090 [Paenibacillus sp. LHD-117]|uniref:hypothetical protein n=1 Tax=Paenibacillus sp. LHD-117 TaxID=3071412 RepID=UPI0027E1C6B3|nr:hypothetical protein [Paenibacillus sp. LHD-117]MDQ6420556.1 hypothetical protein [Paenibacillus sp. LHD-117]
MSYVVKADLGSNTGKRGERASLKVQFDKVQEGRTIDKSFVRISDYGIFDVMKKQEDGTFLWSYPIPWEAPIRTYNIDVYAIDTEGNKGPIETIKFQVTA